jgi:hypothetical protein
MTTKRQQTMAKMTRERAVREKRERKIEKKRAAAAERKARAAGVPLTPGPDEHEPSGEDVASPGLLDPHLADRDDGAVLGESVVPGL